jgi:tellurium resistance protein TerD
MGINLGSLATTPQTDIKAQVAAPTPAPQPIIPEGVDKVTRPDGGISLNLKKGISLDLSKAIPTLKNITVGLGWDPAQGASMDLDVFALALHNGKVLTANDIVFFNQRNLIPGITLSEDSRDGQGEGDDETIIIDLDKIPSDITGVAIFVNIFEADKKQQNFGMVSNSYCRLVNNATGKEEAIFVLNESDSALFNAFHFVTFTRNATGWTFETVAKGLNGDVGIIANQYV